MQYWYFFLCSNQKLSLLFFKLYFINFCSDQECFLSFLMYLCSFCNLSWHWFLTLLNYGLIKYMNFFPTHLCLVRFDLWCRIALWYSDLSCFSNRIFIFNVLDIWNPNTLYLKYYLCHGPQNVLWNKQTNDYFLRASMSYYYHLSIKLKFIFSFL